MVSGSESHCGDYAVLRKAFSFNQKAETWDEKGIICRLSNVHWCGCYLSLKQYNRQNSNTYKLLHHKIKSWRSLRMGLGIPWHLPISMGRFLQPILLYSKKWHFHASAWHWIPCDHIDALTGPSAINLLWIYGKWVCNAGLRGNQENIFHGAAAW